RHAEIIALNLVAAPLQQECELGGGFDALGNDFEVQAVGQIDDGRHTGCVIRIAGDVAHETGVDLELVHREAFQVGEGRVACTKVVNGDGNAKIADLVQGFDGLSRIAHHGGFGQFDLQQGWRNPGITQNLFNGVGDVL